MKSIKTLLAASALATVASAANATVWNLEMNASVYMAIAGGPINMDGFTGTWDDATNAGTWTGTTSAPFFATTLHYTQTFTMNEATGLGTLNQLDTNSCTDNTGSACFGFAPAAAGLFNNTAVNPANSNDYKTQLAFTPADGWTGQWTLQLNRTISDPYTGAISTQYIPFPMNVTLHAPAVPIPTAAWLFGSGLMGLAGAARKRKSV